ncbi:hypothetical protein NT6N_12760 [Oceaniferula spumae]|uniref:Protein GrpE n=1 Tax=Oceaniferula spumae TaxID=2979115 RepID=A0AAT9FJW0_9BACT
MQEHFQENEDVVTEETAADAAAESTSNNETAGAEQKPVEESGEPADNSPEAEIDPWEALELEVAKWKDQAIRNAAELDNYRKRMSREKLDAVRYGNQSLLEELLPVLDNFNMGMQAAAQEQGSMLYMGMDMVHKQIGEFLSSQNVEEIPAEPNGAFDPNLHEAISQEPSTEIAEGNIVRVVRKGYRIGERLLRPSNVTVSLGDQPQPESE